VFAAAATGVYLCHLAAFGVYMLGLVAFEMACLSGTAAYKRMARTALAVCGQAIPALAIHMLAYAPAPAGAPTAADGGSVLSELAFYKIAQFLYTPALLIDAPMAVTTTITVFTAMWTFWGFRQGRLSLSRSGAQFTAALFLAVLLLPSTGFGSAFVDRRILLPLALVAWASLKLTGPDLSAIATRWIAGGIAAGVALISGATFVSWSKQQSQERELRAAMTIIEKGSKVAVVRIDGRNVDLSLRPHTASWSVIDRSVFLSSLYMKPFTPLALRCLPEFVPLASLAQLGAEAPTLASMRETFDYAVVFGRQPATAKYAADLPTVYLSGTARLIRLRAAGPSVPTSPPGH
jgi:hypothetical protein